MNGNKQIIHFLSAADRINYGDLLFPILFEKAANELNIPVIFYNYGLVSSDLEYFGAIKTKSYKRLLFDVRRNKGKLVIGGGEVFFPNWTKLYSYINPIFNKLLNSYKFNKLNNRFNFPRYFLTANKVKEPFCPSLTELNNNVTIHYNSVGGVIKKSFSEERKSHIISSLKSANTLTVRDKRSYDSLKVANSNVKMIADSAILMSDFFSKDELLNLCSPIYKQVEEPYIFLQIAKHYRPKALEVFICNLKILSNKLNLKVVLCPIGLALGHEDEIVLKEIAKKESEFIYCEPKNLYDIMNRIANANLYLGTSLHGAITAQSFNVPFIGLNQNIQKLDDYCKTWFGNDFGNVEMENILNIQERYKNWNFEFVQEKVNFQKEMVYNNIKEILNVKHRIS